ncbi:MAG: hypothetical protein AAF846_21770 [Chloroflexota bacterium]
MRRIERWLHQHVFKVGWLSTHNYQTTTILYYTFFMPGVILHEVVYYLMAGIMNVRAERRIKWPDEQDVAELKLNFVKLAPRTSAFRKAIITSAPLLVGLVVVWLIANNIFDIMAVVERMSSGELVDIVAGFELLLSAPLFWLWVYFIFTIANTMFPTTPKDLRGWRSVLIGLGVVAVALLVIGIGGEIFEALQTPLNIIITVLIQTFVLLILIDLLMVVLLGLIEYTIERITGHSATFRKNKLITMTRQELLEEREKEREREQKRREREQRRKDANTGGPATIYAMTFDIPDAPSKDTITQLEPLAEPNIPEEVPESERSTSAVPLFGGLADEASSTAPATEEERQQREAIAARINLPSRRSVTPPAPEMDDDESEEEVITSAPSAPARSQTEAVPDAVDTSEVNADDVSDEQADKAKAVSLFGDDDDSDEQVVASTPRRFGESSRFGRTIVQPEQNKDADESKTDDEEQDGKSAVASTSARFGNRFSRPATNDDSEDKPTTFTPSRFGSRLNQASDATDDEQQPDTTRPSRFGVKPFEQGDSDDEPEESIRVVGRPASPSLLDDEDDETLDESVAQKDDNRDVIASMFDGISVEQDEDDESLDDSLARRQEGRDAIASMFDGITTDTSDDDDTDSLSEASRFKPASGSRFGSRFGGLSPTPSDNEDEDNSENDSVASRFRSGRSMTSSPFSRPSPVSPTSSDEDGNDEETPSSGSRNRFGIKPSPTGSRFGVSRPAPKPSFSDDTDDELDDDESMGSIGSRRTTSPFRSRFGASPVDADDEVTYEDIDDEYEYEDVEDYVDYDDDEVYYDDDD